MYTLIVSLVIAFLFLIFAAIEFLVNKNKFFENNNYRGISLKKIALTSIMVALTWVLTVFKIPIVPNIIEITIDAIPAMVIGLMYGPLYGFITGIFGNLLYSLVGLTAGFNVGFILTAGVNGAIPGIIILAAYCINIKTNVFNKRNQIILISTLIFLIEAIMALLLYIYYGDLESIVNTNFANLKISPIAFALILFGIGSILNFAVIWISIIIFKKKFSYNTLFLIIFIQIIRSLIISLLLNPLWLTFSYNLPMGPILLLRIIKLPINLFLDIAISLPIFYVVLKIDNENYLSKLEKHLEKIKVK